LDQIFIEEQREFICHKCLRKLSLDPTLNFLNFTELLNSKDDRNIFELFHLSPQQAQELTLSTQNVVPILENEPQIDLISSSHMSFVDTSRQKLKRAQTSISLLSLEQQETVSWHPVLEVNEDLNSTLTPKSNRSKRKFSLFSTKKLKKNKMKIEKKKN